MSRHALVTGATGGLGRKVVGQLLGAGYRVTATGRDAVIGATLGTPFVRADLVSNPLDDLVAGASCLPPRCAVIALGLWARFSRNQCRCNDPVARRGSESGRSRVHLQFDAVDFRRGADRIELTGDSPVASPFANAYAATKYVGECAVLDADVAGFRTVSLRPRAIVGPHDTVLLPRLMRAAGRRRFPLPGGGGALIEPIDVRDAAAAFIAADQPRERAGGQAINLSGGDPRTVHELLAIIFAHHKQELRTVAVPVGLAMAVAGMMERVAALLPGYPEPPATRYTIKTLAFSQTMRLDKAKALLDWTPLYGVEAMIDYALA